MTMQRDATIDYNNDLSSILLFHVVPNNIIYSDQLPCTAGDNLTRMGNGKDSRTLCNNKHPTYQKGAGNPESEKPAIVAVDKKACNGVIHTVDKVLLYRPLAG
jgi:uncharacterized surface protein with fasciclin (FAS1) repeats